LGRTPKANEEADELAKRGDNGLTQVLLIGDAGANTRDEVYQKRKFGSSSWSGRFAKPVFEDEETDKLKAKLIPVHAFYVGGTNKPRVAADALNMQIGEFWPLKNLEKNTI